MVATLVGVMWWGRPLDEAMPRRFEPPATTAAPLDGLGPSGRWRRAATPSRSRRCDRPRRRRPPLDRAAPSARRRSATAPRTDVARPDLEAQCRREVVAPAPSTATSPAVPDRLPKRRGRAFRHFRRRPMHRVDTRTRERRAGLERDARRQSDACESAVDRSRRRSRRRRPSPAVRAARRWTGSRLPRPRPAAAPAASPPPPAVADAAPDSRSAPSSAAAQTDSTAVQKSRVAPERLARSPVAPPIASAAARRRRRPNTALRTATSLARWRIGRRVAPTRRTGRPARVASSRIGPPTRSPLAPLRAALVTEPGRWTWSADGRRVQRVTPALLAWLARLDAALAAPSGRQPTGPSPRPNRTTHAGGMAPTGPVRTLVLLHEGRRHTELRLGEALEVTPIDPPGPRWRAALAPEDRPPCATAFRSEGLRLIGAKPRAMACATSAPLRCCPRRPRSPCRGAPAIRCGHGAAAARRSPLERARLAIMFGLPAPMSAASDDPHAAPLPASEIGSAPGADATPRGGRDDRRSGCAARAPTT